MVAIPFLRSPFFREGTRFRFAHSARESSGPLEEALLDRVYEGGADLDELAQQVVAAGAATDVDEARRELRRAFSEPDNLIGLVDVPLLDEYDLVIVDQGYGGVYVHTVELLKKLAKRWRCLLLSPESPLFDDIANENIVTLKVLQRQHRDLTYFAYVHIVRSIVRRTRCRLLLITHRSQSLFLFDIVREKRTVIYCDGFYDGSFKHALELKLRNTEPARRRILSEIYYLVANGAPSFFGLLATPSVNIHLLMAGCFSLRDARENWCWGQEQTCNFARAFPSLKILFMPPFTDPDLFEPQLVERERVVLFTTTMHNIEKKGFPELVKAMQRFEDFRVRCVVRQPQRLPPYPRELDERFDMGSLEKREMVKLYHRVWVNCRTSREESSPVSILESMICEVPQVISPVVANQIPLLEDGRTGFIVDPDDTRGLVRALRTILADEELRDRMGAEARRRATEYALERRIDVFERHLA